MEVNMRVQTMFSGFLVSGLLAIVGCGGSGGEEPGRASSALESKCVFTQGYWKNHPAAWPVSSLTLGSVGYSEAQALSIFKTPVQGNGLISLAHQLMAAKLNLAAGADGSSIA